MTDFNKYFVFSNTQLKLKTEIEGKLGRTYIPGSVIVRGTPKQFTEITDKPNTIKFPDTVIIWSGDIRTVTYSDQKVQ